MRVLLAVILTALALPAAAQSAARPRPPGTLPLQELPPPPAMPESDPALEPRPVVTVRQEGDNAIQEYRVNGRLYMMRVTPKHGRAYVMIDHKGDGTFTRQDNPTDTGVRVPQWVLLEF